MFRWFRSSNSSALPRPTGAYTVGFVDYEWTPPSSEHTTSPPSHVLARIYYPSLPVAKHEPSDPIESGWSGRSHWIPSTSYYPVENAPPAPIDELPAVVFSHGLGGIRTTYSSVCSDLASHGYVVAAIEHRYIIRWDEPAEF